jgi:hypothetical protein
MRFFMIVVVVASGCATEHAASVPSMSSFSTPSTSFQTSYAGRGSSFVDVVRVEADLVVRPDTVCVPVEISAVAKEDAVAMSLVEDAAKALPLSGGRLRIDDIDASSERTADGARSKVLMRGVVEIALPDATPWERARLVGALHRSLAEKVTIADGSKAYDDDKPEAHVAIGNPQLGVKDLEQHRPKLLSSWSERAKALATSVVTQGENLELQGCVPPTSVQIVPGGTLEKVGLTLPVNCTFRVKRS